MEAVGTAVSRSPPQTLFEVRRTLTFSDVFGLVRQAAQYRLNDAAKIWRETLSKDRRQVDEQRDESLSDVSPWGAGVVDNLWQHVLHALDPQARENL